MFEIVEQQYHTAKLKVIGIGGGGGNALNTMIEAGLEDVEFIAINTDRQVLSQNQAPCQIQLGSGLGAGGMPEIGRQAATEGKDRIREILEGAHMVFLTAGMGGGTGTGAAPIVAQVAKDLGALTVAVVTKPFLFEGKRRIAQAEEGIEELRKHVDTLITIPNQKLVALAGQDMTMLDAFTKADEVLLNAVRSISELITIPGLINLDFADVKHIMAESGLALMGTGEGEGDNRAIEAANMAISSPLLENVAIDGAQGVLINITSGPDISMNEINDAVSLVQDVVAQSANIIFGVVINQRMSDKVRITVIATGFDMPMAGVGENEFEDRRQNYQRAFSTGDTVPKAPATKRISYLEQRMESRPIETRSERPSILERFKRKTDPAKYEETEYENGPQAASAAAGNPGARPANMPVNVSNGKAGADDDEYDVPAFLRRQPD